MLSGKMFASSTWQELVAGVKSAGTLHFLGLFSDGNVHSHIDHLKAMIERINPNCIIEIDGGISADNAAEVLGAGVDVVVAGSAVFCAEDPEAEIVKILEA